jgi:hypothetical protein
MVTRLAAVAAVAPIAAPMLAPSILLFVLLIDGAERAVVFNGLYQLSELFEIRLVSCGAMPAASSAMRTRFAWANVS